MTAENMSCIHIKQEILGVMRIRHALFMLDGMKSEISRSAKMILLAKTN